MQGFRVLGKLSRFLPILLVAAACEDGVTAVEGQIQPQSSHDPTVPGEVTDLQVVSATQNAVTLRWTQVSNGAGGAANYGLQYGSPTVTFDLRATSRTTAITGTAAGQAITYTVSGLTPATQYQFQLMSYRGSASTGVVLGHLSNKATGSTASSRTLTGLTLSPASASVAAGGSVQFAVSGQWSDGSTSVPPVTYSATGGAITSAGLYTAGSTAGTYRVIARHDASGLADTAAVTVTTATPPPPPPSGSLLLREGFDDGNASGRGWYDNTRFTITTAERRVGTGSLAWSWARGATLPSFGAAARHSFTATDQIYVAYWVKYSSNWAGSGVSYHPHEFQLLTTADGRYTGPSFTHLTTYIEHIYGPNGGVPQIGTTDGANIDQGRIGQDLSRVTEARATAGCNGNTDGIATDCYRMSNGKYNNGKWLRPAGNAAAFLPNPGPGYKGDWHRVEVFFRMNSVVNGIGQTDGVAQYWFDGQLLIDRQNVLFRTGANPTMRWNQILLGPYIGVGSPVAQTAWIDDLVVATARP